MLYIANKKVDNGNTKDMKKTSPLTKIVYDSSRSLRATFRLSLLVLAVWCISLFFLNRDTLLFQWFVSDAESLRALLGSIFQGLASFFAIIVSVSLLVAQLAYGSFSPRLMPNFLKNRAFLSTVFLFIGALALNAILLSVLTEETVGNLLPLVIFDLFISLTALVSIVPASFVLLNSAHPMKIGWDLVERFNDSYFSEIPFKGASASDESLPMLQSLIVKSLRDADTDYATRLIGSFGDKVESHLNDDNAVTFAGYFDSFFKKIIFIASQENEEGVLQQLVFANEALEKKVAKSRRYLTNTDIRSEGSFARNIIYIIELSIKNRHDQVVGRAQGAMYRLREILVPSIPPDDEIATFRTVSHFRDKKDGEINNADINYANERIYEYVSRVYFESNSALALEALRLNNTEATRDFVREIFRSRYTLYKLDPTKYKEVIKRIAYSDFFNLSRLSHLSIKSNVGISDEVAVGIQEARDFFLKIDPKLAESYIDLLGQLMIETTEREIPNSDPNSTFYWAGVAFRMLLHPAPVDLPIKLLGYFEKVLLIIKERQKRSSSPILEKMKETICEEIGSVRNYKDSDKSILDKAEAIIVLYPEVKLKKS